MVTNPLAGPYTERMAEPVSDEELLVRGGAEGFAVLYERRHALIRGYLRRRLELLP